MRWPLIVMSLAAVAAGQDRPAATPQRPGFATDTATTAPGSIELEIGPTFNTSAFNLPTSLKLTPAAESGFFKEMEFAFEFESLDEVSFDGDSTLEFGESVELKIRKPFRTAGRWSFALAPKVQVFLRNQDGVRLGGVAIAEYDFGLNSIIGNLAGSAATNPANGNPEWLLSFIGSYGRTFGRSGTPSRFSVFFDARLETASRGNNVTSFMQGILYRVRPQLVLDAAVQQRGVFGAKTEVLALTGVTYNFGRIWRN